MNCLVILLEKSHLRRQCNKRTFFVNRHFYTSVHEALSRDIRSHDKDTTDGNRFSQFWKMFFGFR